MVVGDLKKFGSYRLIGWNPWFIGIGTVGRCDLTEVGVAFLKEVCHCGGRL